MNHFIAYFIKWTIPGRIITVHLTRAHCTRVRVVHRTCTCHTHVVHITLL